MLDRIVTGKRASILRALGGGDRRSLGQANHAAEQAANNPKIFAELIAGMWHADAVVRMRAADAVEKASRDHPELLAPFKAELLGLLAETTQQELRWHLAQMVPRLELNQREQRRVVAALVEYLEDRSAIVKTMAMQSLAEIASEDEKVRELIRGLARTGTAAMRARGRKILSGWEKRSK